MEREREKQKERERIKCLRSRPVIKPINSRIMHSISPLI